MAHVDAALQRAASSPIYISADALGLEPQEVQELAAASEVRATGQIVKKIADLSRRLGVAEGAALTILRSLNTIDIPVERLPEALAAVLARILVVRQELERQCNENRDAADLGRKTLGALDAGAFDQATRLLNVILVRERDASARRRSSAEGDIDRVRELQSEAATCASLAHLALARRDIVAAQVHFEEGFQALAPAAADLRWSYASGAAAALHDLGERAAIDGALTAAIRMYRMALSVANCDGMPLEWGITQNNLGNALASLGASDDGPERLNASLEAYRSALSVWTRDRSPVDWAVAQSNLGNALELLSEREEAAAPLEQAIAAYRAALGIWTREHAPLDWATTQLNLGNALRALGTRTGDAMRLKEAIATYRPVLEVVERDEKPLDWAAI